MAKTKTADIWHYPGKGDFPEPNELVWVQAVTLAPWVQSMVKASPSASLIRFQSEAIYRGVMPTTKLHMWEGLESHDVVAAWRKHESPGDVEEIKKATRAAQVLAASNDAYLFRIIGSSLGLHLQKMRPVILEKMKRFKNTLRKIGEQSFVSEGTPCVDTYCHNYWDETNDLIYVVEQFKGHGVIRQTKKGESESTYAKDFPGNTIYKTPQEAALALVKVAKEKGWTELL